ncbi:MULTISPECIES: hypothetical protein [Acinetobacter]|uniref:Uncharacterized protein n=4 Tax=Acinetobacter TaxID=469 RepID=N9DDM3_9GAMM|nr:MULTISPECIES: hypothetical protein [Acinetobacter]ENV78835.1 hypothetical protein F942_02677 [Acinetobacter ursingii ANC 3649]MEC6125924.1 hypothetical protein [Acinetobacter ursingii]QXZ24050.1 hypothetical protein I6L31_04530 [Acinetobacter septicus]RSC23709.1 hypothetical protein EGS47_13640 [Acinetobacter sp. FDAARGOS_515]
MHHDQQELAKQRRHDKQVKRDAEIKDRRQKQREIDDEEKYRLWQNKIKTMRRLGENVIKDEDLFKLLKKIYNNKYDYVKANVDYVRGGIFNETISVIVNLEQKLLSIHKKAYPTKEEFLLAKQNNDQRTLDKILKFYWSMRVDLELLRCGLGTHQFSQNIRVYILSLQKSKYGRPLLIEADEWNIDTFPADDIFKFIDELIIFTSNIALKQRQREEKEKQEENEASHKALGGVSGQYEEKSLFELQNQFSLNEIACEAGVQLDPERGLTLSFLERFAREKENFRENLLKYKKLQVLFLEITLQPQECIAEKRRILLLENRFKLTGCCNAILASYDLLTSYSTLELGVNFCIILKVVLIFREKRNLNFDVLKLSIKNNFIKQMNDTHEGKEQDFKIAIRDMGELIKYLDDRYSDVILYRSTAARNAFEYWLLGYFYRADYFLKPELGYIGDTLFIDNHIDNIFLYSSKLVPDEKKALKQKQNSTVQQDEFFSQLDFSKQQKHIWRITDLPKHVEEELRLITFMYSQKYIQRDDQAKLRLLTSIEHFMRLLQYKSDSTCIGLHPNTSALEVSKNPLKKLSKQAKQYLTIFNSMPQESRYLNEMLISPEIGWRVKFFVTIFKKNNDEIRLNIKGVHELERRLKRFKDLTQDTVDQQTIPELFKMEKLAAILLRRNRQEALGYLKKSLVEDVFAFRLQLSYDQAEDKSSDLTFAEEKIAFNELLTHFLKDLKRTKKNSNAVLLAFIGTRLLKAKRLSADITFFFSAKELSDYDDEENKTRINETIEKVQSYWKEYIKNKQINRKQTSQQSEGENVENIAEQNKVSQHAPEMYDLSNFVFQAISKYVTISKEKQFSTILKLYEDKTLKQLQSSIVDFYVAHALLCTWETPLPAETITQGTETNKQDIKDSNKDNSNEEKGKNGRPRRIDQFIKGHVISAKKQKDKNNKQNKKSIPVKRPTQVKYIKFWFEIKPDTLGQFVWSVRQQR